MSKMSSHDPFEHLKHKLWLKEGPGIKLAIWPPTTKSWESPPFPCVQVSYNILLYTSSQSEVYTQSYGPPKSEEFQLWEFQNSPLESFETKWHLGAGLVARHKIYYKGEGGDFPQVWAVVSFVSLCLHVTCPCTKVLQLHTNQLVVWFVQVRVSNWIVCQSS